jgi:3-oxoacyl-[acyl-carrier protein] reductase
VAVVTGGSRGIGRAIALRLAEDHAAVAITFRQAGDEATDVVEQIEAAGGQALAIQADFADPAVADDVVAQVLARFGGVDSLVNNAGGATRRTIAELSVAEWSEGITVNLTSAYAMTRAVVPHMLERAGGSIVNVGSPAGLRGGYIGVHYSAAKAGMIGLTVQAARELTASGIRVNVVEPSAVETDMVRGLMAGDDQLDIKPLRGQRGTPEEIAAVVGFLCSPQASYVSGAVIGISGGGF